MSERAQKGKSILAPTLDYTIIDLETTGLSPAYDEIIEVAAIRCRGGQEVDRYQVLVKPKAEISEYISSLTHITNAMVADARTIAQVLPEFLSFIGKDIVVGHNVSFDINFIYDNAIHLGLPPFTNNYIDTMRMARMLYYNIPNHKLGTIAKYLGVAAADAHRAIGDCITTQQCYAIMIQQADELQERLSQSHKDTHSLAKSIFPQSDDFNQNSPIYGMAFVFTGKLERMTRAEAMQLVVNAGGVCYDTVNGKVNYLVLGNNDYLIGRTESGKSSKQRKAEKMRLEGKEIEIIPESVFWDMFG